MQYSILRDILGQPWQIEASAFQRFFPLAVAALNGTPFQKEEPPQEYLPFMSGVLHSESENDNSKKEAVPVINVQQIRDIILKHDAACGPIGMRTQARWLRQAEANENVIGHVLIFETGGGASNAVPEMAEAIAECNKPVLAFIEDYCCSAGIYIAGYCKEIHVSRPTAMVGCIGTMMVYRGRKSKSEEDQNREIEVTIYADQAFEKNEEYEKAINEFDFTLAKKHILNPHNEKFIADMRKNRPEIQDEHLHGRTFQASEVMGALVDSISTFDQVLERVYELSEKKKPAAKNMVTGSNTDKMKYKKIQSTLQLDDNDFIVETDGRRTFTIEEMEALENSLGAGDSPELQTQLDAANVTIGERDTTIGDLTGQVEQANNTISERDTTIEELTAQIATLKGKPAEAPAAVHVQSDGKKPAEGQPISAKYANPFDALEEISNEYLGKSLNK
jgi:ClpP class serine protease